MRIKAQVNKTGRDFSMIKAGFVSDQLAFGDFQVKVDWLGDVVICEVAGTPVFQVNTIIGLVGADLTCLGNDFASELNVDARVLSSIETCNGVCD